MREFKSHRMHSFSHAFFFLRPPVVGCGYGDGANFVSVFEDEIKSQHQTLQAMAQIFKDNLQRNDENKEVSKEKPVPTTAMATMPDDSLERQEILKLKEEIATYKVQAEKMNRKHETLLNELKQAKQELGTKSHLVRRFVFLISVVSIPLVLLSLTNS